ncbi:Alpha-ketoglutarate-dependent dioxygenase FTO isoform X1 [Aix galericulata]|nr:Alpha-ketoglutarate-dependent dioxygenase FTO isoform X1 [Aix galericulata]
MQQGEGAQEQLPCPGTASWKLFEAKLLYTKHGSVLALPPGLDSDLKSLNAILHNRGEHLALSKHPIKCQSEAAESLPEDQKPECHPFWTNDECNMPLPYDLEEKERRVMDSLLEIIDGIIRGPSHTKNVNSAGPRASHTHRAVALAAEGSPGGESSAAGQAGAAEA